MMWLFALVIRSGLLASAVSLVKDTICFDIVGAIFDGTASTPANFG